MNAFLRQQKPVQKNEPLTAIDHFIDVVEKTTILDCRLTRVGESANSNRASSRPRLVQSTTYNRRVDLSN